MTRMANETSVILRALRSTIDAVLEIGRRVTDGGKAIDDHQVHAERLAYAATEVRAAEALATYAADRRAAGAPDDITDLMAAAFAGEIAAKLRGQVEAHLDDFGVGDELLGRTLGSPDVAAAVRAAQHESRFREIGQEVIRTRGANNAYIDGDIAEMARDSARPFARKRGGAARRAHPSPRRPRARVDPRTRCASSATSACRCPRSTAARAWATWR